jgi:two-component system, LytTR family, response regulator
MQTQTKSAESVLVRESYQYQLIDLNQVGCFEFYGRNLFVFLNGQKKRLQGNYNNLEERLNPNKFFRISKRYIINLDKVQDVKSREMGHLQLKINGMDKWFLASPEMAQVFVKSRSL